MQYNIPHLQTALTGRLEKLERQLLEQQTEIEAWFRKAWQQTPPPFYGSVDLRNAGYKIAPVDTNLFPAGFNNLSPELLPLSIQAVQATIERLCPKICDILLIPENHTRNMFYLENVAVLRSIIAKAGFRVRIGSLIEDLKETKRITLNSGEELLLEPVQREAKRIYVDDYNPDIILLNNDLSDGVPDILKDIEQVIMPSTQLGWATRLKSSHFQYLDNVAVEFGQAFGFDPWVFSPLFRQCGEINFMTREGEDCLIRNAHTLLEAIKIKYREHHVENDPFLVIKADAGTYGMAVMMIKNPEDIRHLNRKQRTKMSAIKGGKTVSRVIIQEGVYTNETWGKEAAVAEPVVYLIGRHVVGGFYRVHANRGVDENLNSPGMNFEPLAFSESCQHPGELSDEPTNRFYSYGVVARLALLAAGLELREVSHGD